MLRIILTGVTFNYPNGYDEDYTGVNLTFNNSGTTYNLSGYVTITKEAYTATNGDRNLLTKLIREHVSEQLEETETTGTSDQTPR